MKIEPQIYAAKVMHKRLFPKVNKFTYGIYYLALPLPADPIPSKIAKFSAKDLGNRDGSDPEGWAKEMLDSHDLLDITSDIMLITMPEIMGYVFNPVSFYFCLDRNKNLRAVIAEVHNTFGEQHSYICKNNDDSTITSNDWIEAEKLFHVSPFLKREGIYKFRFSLVEDKLGIWIDYYDAAQNKQLLTSLSGKLSPLDKKSLRKVLFKYPLVTLKTIILIHWQALKLFLKGIKYINKPEQKETTTSSSR